MSRKDKRIAAMAGQFPGGKLDSHYSGYFELFNRQRFYEAHEVLEHIWLKDKYGPNGAFYKGLIQLAGAFVHLQKNRPGPAAALFKLARTNLEKYPPLHEHLNLKYARGLIEHWLDDLARAPSETGPVMAANWPTLTLEAGGK